MEGKEELNKKTTITQTLNDSYQQLAHEVLRIEQVIEALIGTWPRDEEPELPATKQSSDNLLETLNTLALKLRTQAEMLRKYHNMITNGLL